MNGTPGINGTSATSATHGNRGLRIVRLANFVTPSSGGLRTALRELGAGYLAAGHEPVLIVPGDLESDRQTPQGRIITLPGPEIPGTGGYRVLAGRRRLRQVLESLEPDRLEVSDRTTLRWTGEWARRRRIPAVMVSHETADGVLRTWGLPGKAAERAADRLNRRSAWSYTRIVCTTEWAEREFVRIGARNVVRAPLGVDLEHCRPGRRSTVLRAKHAAGARVLLLMCSRLSVEKRPGMALDTLAKLRERGVRATLVVAGEGPLKLSLIRRALAERLPVEFLGHVADREKVADLQAAADLCLAPGPAETFGLSALEALACGTPVVASASSALPEVIGDAGAAAADTPEDFADAVQDLLARPEHTRRAAARARAELFDWQRSVTAFLTAHDAPPTRPEGPALDDTRPAGSRVAGVPVAGAVEARREGAGPDGSWSAGSRAVGDAATTAGFAEARPAEAVAAGSAGSRSVEVRRDAPCVAVARNAGVRSDGVLSAGSRTAGDAPGAAGSAGSRSVEVRRDAPCVAVARNAVSRNAGAPSGEVRADGAGAARTRSAQPRTAGARAPAAFAEDHPAKARAARAEGDAEADAAEPLPVFGAPPAGPPPAGAWPAGRRPAGTLPPEVTT